MKPSVPSPGVRSLKIATVVTLLAGISACSSEDAAERCARDEDCPAGKKCQTATGFCYTDTTKRTLKDAAEGTFSCPLEAASSQPPEGGQLDLNLEVDGTLFIFNACRAVKMTRGAETYSILLIGADQQITRSVALEVQWRGARHQVGSLTVPKTAQAAARLSDDATFWAKTGSVILDKAATTLGETVEGSLKIDVEAFRDKPFSSICTLIHPCDASCRLVRLEGYSPDCHGNARCLPNNDGSNRGFCTKACASDGDCARDPQGTCKKSSGSSSGVCLHRCSGPSDCESSASCKANLCIP